ERLKESLDLSPYDIYHHTRSEYIFDLNKITIVDRLSIEEYDGDFELFDVYLKDINGNEILIEKDIVSSGDDVAKTHLLTNSNNNVKIKSVIIRLDGSAGGMWQFNSIIINP
ncbi:MAG: hypothetical protein GXO11_00105, partial [Epsilonproteobacteria bacterium]|nr:hypothetical protein [Campylobacterota bacterium]